VIVQRKDGALGPDSDLLQSGQRYTVYAILLGSPNQFLVCEERSLSFPFFVSLDAIDFVDTRLPGCLHYSPPLPSTEEYSSRSPLLAFPEMVSDRLFYQKLVDGDEDAKRVWQRVKRSIDAGANKRDGGN